MTGHTAHRPHVPRAATVLTVALVAALVFGVIVLAGGDWIPGIVIVVSSIIGIARQVPALHQR